MNKQISCQQKNRKKSIIDMHHIKKTRENIIFFLIQFLIYLIIYFDYAIYCLITDWAGAFPIII